jgi:hypothetical protein
VRRPVERTTGRSWLLRVVVTCIALTVLMGIASLALAWSRAISGADGQAADATPITMYVGTERLTIPANMVRFAGQREVGPHERIDLAVHWPSLEGYTLDRREDFLDGSADAPVLFLTVRTRQTATDSAGRFVTVYRHFLEEEALPAPEGLVGRLLSAGSGLAGEEVYFQPDAASPFATHCLAPDASGYPPLCLTEFHAGADLSVQVRFRKGLLDDWAGIRDAARMLMLRFGVVS